MHSPYGLVHFCWSLKNLLLLSYSKLHSKSCDYLYKLHSFNTQDHRSTRALLISETVQKMSKITYTATLLAESLRSFLDKSGKRKRLCLPLPDLSRKIEGDSVRRVLYGEPVLTFDKRQICEEILKGLRFNVIKNLLSLFFINGFITMRVTRHFEYSCKRCL